MEIAETPFLVDVNSETVGLCRSQKSQVQWTESIQVGKFVVSTNVFSDLDESDWLLRHGPRPWHPKEPKAGVFLVRDSWDPTPPFSNAAKSSLNASQWCGRGAVIPVSFRMQCQLQKSATPRAAIQKKMHVWIVGRLSTYPLAIWRGNGKSPFFIGVSICKNHRNPFYYPLPCLTTGG